MAKMIRVKAVLGALVQQRDTTGRLLPNRFVGLTPALEIDEAGAMVEATPDIRRAIIRGELLEVPDAAPGGA